MLDPEATKVALSVSAALGLGPGVRGALARIFGPALDAIGDSLKARTSAHLQRNLRTVAVRAAEMVEETGRKPTEISPRLALPLFDGASLEDDAELQERWAALIANASLPEASRRVRPAFADALTQMQSIDANALILLNQLTGPGAVPSSTPVSLQYFCDQGGRGEVASSSMNLLASLGFASVHLGLATKSSVATGEGTILVDAGPPWDRLVEITDLGIEFLAACTPPAPVSEGEVR